MTSSSIRFRERHLSHLAREIQSFRYPLDGLLRYYFRQHKALGSKDRAWLSETLYHYVRWKNTYDYLHLPVTHPLPHLATLDLPLEIQLGTPPELLKRLETAYGLATAVQICEINQSRAPLTLRANRLKTSREALLKELAPQGKVAPTPRAPEGLYFDSKVPLNSLPSFQQGLFEVQDESSQLASLLVRPVPRDHILDYCAGAGGKSLAMAPLLNGSGQLYLHDRRSSALQEAKKRCKRAGIQNVQFNLPPRKETMDWVVVDAPCTGTGTYRRNPDLKWKFPALHLPQLLEEQRAIVHDALSYLRPGGRLVYMTCSILPPENEVQQLFFQERYGLKYVEKFQILPQLNGPDGFFAVSLQKT